ncbi:hypothetical protein Patl1_32351 [Pistacia atlantica]|uniref:Uncharacterized protein n=1 Tax=Pistacia atlantica TaxID=434234 RepID=A0ACC1APZ6_9ROSI|nr:hypothetical protein Patl1_32351 [Pistacia atlantica]
MMELGEGLGKLRKMNFSSGPFHEFEREISATLDFIYQTQIELAACINDLCLAMDQSERSYQLLGDYGAGQHLYHLESDHNEIMYVVFHPQRSYAPHNSLKIGKLANAMIGKNFSMHKAKQNQKSSEILVIFGIVLKDYFMQEALVKAHLCEVSSETEKVTKTRKRKMILGTVFIKLICLKKKIHRRSTFIVLS